VISRPITRWFALLVTVIVAVRCSNDFTPPSVLLPAHINMLGGNQQAGVVGERLTDTLVVRVTDSRDRPVKDQAILFQLIAGGAGAQLIPDTALTDADGQAKSVWVLGQLAGLQRVEARVLADGPSSGLIATFTSQAQADVPDTAFAVQGDGQAGLVDTPLPDSLVVLVADRFGNPIAGETVNWSVPAGQGTVSASSLVTGADGRAAVQRILGPTAGSQTATAVWTGLPGNPIVFTATAGAGGVARLVKLFGDNQTAPAGQQLTDSIVVQAQDLSGNGVAGRDVVWVVSGGGGSISAATTVTDAQGKAFVRWTLGTVAGPNSVTAAITGLPQVQFNANGTASQPTRIQALSSTTLSGPNSTPVFPPPSVRVLDANNNGVQGVTVTFQVTAGGGTVSDGTGSGASVTIATNSTGTATLTSWILGPTAGTNNNIVTATAAGTGITGNPVTFTASATAGQAARLAFIQQPTNTGAGVIINPAVTVQVQDLGGNPVTTATNPITVTFDANPGSGTLGGTRTVNAIGGLATFNNLTVDKTGTGYTLSATATGLVTATSAAFNITPGPAAKLGFIVQPSNPGAGAPMTPAVQVAVQDQFGNTVPTATNAISLAFGNNPTGATLSGDLNNNAVAGVATFPDLSVNLTGVGYTIVASATGLTAATSQPFNIGFGTATKLAFIQQPTNVQAGSIIAPAVTVAIQDANGNTVATATDSVFLNLGANPGGSSLSGNRVQAVAGIATFNGLVLTAAGNGYTLVASSGSLTGATSTPFNVTSGSGVRLEFIQHPTSAQAAAAITPAVTVRMVDINNNTVTSFAGPITVAFGTNPTPGAVLSGTLTQNAVAGIATFNNLSVNLVGTGYTLVATNPGVPGGTAISNGFNITPGPAAALVVVNQPPTVIPAVAGEAISPPVTVQVVDAGGNPVIGSTAAITMSIFTNPGGSTLTGTLTVNASGGLATFSNLILNRSGTGYVLRASSGTLTAGNTVPFNVRANSPAVLVFAQQPTNVAAGAVITPAVTVQVRDAFGNLADANGSVNLEFVNNPGGATLGGSVDAIPVNSIATFSNLNVNKTGTGYTLRASTSGLIPDTSAAFNVTAGGASKLAFSVQPTSTTAGANIAPAVVVQVRDANDNVVTSSTAAITMAILNNPGGATLGGTTTVNAVAGVATFSSLNLNRTGSGYTLRATSGSLTAATSDAFNINPGAPTALVWTVQPTNGTAGAALSPAPQITVRDALGNTVTSFSTTITITIGNNPGGSTLTGITSAIPFNGVADFSSLALNRPGNGYTLIASAGGVPPNATSAAFNIVAGSGNQLAFVVAPSVDTVGKPMAPAVQVAVRDAQGNTVPGATNQITLALVNNPGGAVLTGNTANAVNGVATFSALRLDKASTGYTLIANAAGLISTPVSEPFNILLAPTTTAITADSPDPSVVGQGYAVNYTVTVTAPASGTPTGNVTVSDGSASCTNTVAAGTCTLTSTTAGAKTLTATYAGDANFQTSTSANVAHTVNPAATTTTITGDNPDPSFVGVAYAVSFTVAANAPGSGTPTGNVTVSDGTGATCVGTVAAGTCNLTSTTVGAKTLTATYATDGNFAGSTSAGVAHTVSASATVTTITADTPDPSVVGQPIPVAFTVSGGTTAPTGNVTVSDGTVNCTATVAVGTCNLTPTSAGAKTLIATYAGDATHAGSTSAGVAHTVNPAATTTTITGDTPDPSSVGVAYAVTYTVAVTAPGTGTATGNVTVSDGAGASCVATVAAGTCNLTSTVVGAKTLTATYAGSTDFASSVSAGVAHNVNASNTTTTITADTPDPSVVGQPIPVTFTVTGGTTAPTGNVTVSDGAANCTGTVAAGTCNLVPTSAGAKTLTATYAGDATHAGSTSAGVAHTVNAAATTTTITSDTPDPSTAGSAYAVNYTVTVNSPGAGTPTGNVTVSDGSGATCIGTVAAGTCNLTSTTAGAKTLTATYATDGNFAGSTSAGVAHTVNTGGTTTTITGDTPDPSVVGQAVTVNFTVSGPPGQPTGTVTVSDGTVNCNGTLTAGAGSCALTFTTPGAKTLTATYGGDGNHAGSTSAGVAHTVNQAATTTSISSDNPDPSVVGQAYTVNYAVAVTAPGAGTPTGNVTVSDGTNNCVGTVAAGSCSLTSTTAGAKTLTATYAGDANFTTSNGTTAHQVNTAATTTTITADTPDPSTVNAAYTVNFTVVANAPGAGTPTGNVTVSDGTGATCVGTVAAGTCNLTSTTAGAKTLTATYATDGNFAGSTSAGVPHTVNTGGTTTTITSDNPDPSVVGQVVTVNFSVTGAPGTPTGTVTVTDGTVNCNGTLGGAGTGSCNLTFTTVGAKTLTATYGGDATHAGSTSANVAHTVNQAATTTSISSDNPDPSVVGQAYTVNYAVAVTAPGAGTPTGNVTVSDGTNNCVGTVAAGSCSLTSTTAGAKTLTATYAGDANFTTSNGTTGHTVNTAATTTTITADTPDPSTAGAAYAVNYTVAVTVPGAGTPTGNVTVSDGTGASCIGTVAAGTCNLTSTTAGAKTLTATYAGDANFAGSVSPGVGHTVNTGGTTTTITSDTPDPSVTGQSVTVNFSVTGAPGTPTGTVTVTDGTVNCNGTLGGAGTGSCNLTFTTAGAKTLTATYGGDATHAGSTSANVSHQVNQAATTTTITGDTPDPSTVNAAYTVSFTVVANAPGAGTPTGNVTVTDGTDQCVGTVAAGSCSLTSTTAGAKTLTATYATDGNFAGSTSAGVSHTVDAFGTTTTVSSSQDPSTFGQSVSFTAAVTSGGGTPTGNVQFVVDGSNFGLPVALNGSGQATSGATSILAVGDHTVVANFLGSTNFQASSGSIGGGGQTVNEAPTTTTITGHTPDPSTTTEAVTVTVSVTSATGTPTGSVTVGDGVDSCVITLAGGTGNCQVTLTTTGARTLTAAYAGDGSFAASNSAGVGHTVN